MVQIHNIRRLWFDVGIKRYTTTDKMFITIKRLWFDVGIKRYTTRGTKQREFGIRIA